jgi:hypothetical protein
LNNIPKDPQNLIKNGRLELKGFCLSIEKTNCFTFSFQYKKIFNKMTWRRVGDSKSNKSYSRDLQKEHKYRDLTLESIKNYNFKGFNKR